MREHEDTLTVQLAVLVSVVAVLVLGAHEIAPALGHAA
jgi:hypothetical protein